jgi:hypothetical protein
MTVDEEAGRFLIGRGDRFVTTSSPVLSLGPLACREFDVARRVAPTLDRGR